MGMRRSDEKLSAAKRENSVIMIEEDYKEHYEGYDPNSPESTIMFAFMHSRNMSKSVELAQYVQKNVCAIAKRPDKGVKQDVFLVLRETSMAACLIELGFITTPDEERFLNDKKNIDKIAKGIYNAFVQYKNKYGKACDVKYKPLKDDDDDEPEVKVRPVEKRKKADRKEDDEKVSSKKARDKEPEMVKYTCGSSTDYNEIYRLRKSLLDKFPQAFIIAFKNGEKMDVRQAIREFKSNK